jgi:hypothetical protein
MGVRRDWGDELDSETDEAIEAIDRACALRDAAVTPLISRPPSPSNMDRSASEEPCCVCFEAMDKARWRCSQCDNATHIACFEQWRNHSCTCPYCRHPVENEEHSSCCIFFVGLMLLAQLTAGEKEHAL